MPSGSIQQQHGMSAFGDVQGYLVDMQLHHVGVSMGQSEGRAHASFGADGAEEIGVLIALVGRLGRSCAAPRPLPDEPALLDISPATRPANPATSTSLGAVAAAATPTSRLAVEMMPSLAPRTAARNQPIRSIRCVSR